MQLFDTLSIDIVLIRMEIWSNGNRITYPSDNDIFDLQDSFSSYLIGADSFDVANLLRFITIAS